MAIQFDINSYRNKFKDDISRQYLFYANITFPSIGNAAATGIGAGLSSNSRGDGLSSAAVVAADLAAYHAGTMGLKMGMDSVPFLVKSTSLPNSTYEEMTSYWMGNVYKLPGNRTYDDWTVTFVVDGEGYIVKKFYDWQRMIRNPSSNLQTISGSYLKDQRVSLVTGKGDLITSFKLFNAWPKAIGQVLLDYGSNEVSTIDITFAYQYFEVTNTPDSQLTSILKRAGYGGATGAIGAI